MASRDILYEDNMKQARRRQAQLQEQVTRRAEELAKWKEAAWLFDVFMREWKAQTQKEPTITQIRDKYGGQANLSEAAKKEVERARGIAHLRTLAAKADDAMRNAQST